MMAHHALGRQRAAPLAWAAGALAAAHVPAAVAILPALAVLRGPLGIALALLAFGMAAAPSVRWPPGPTLSPRSAHALALGAAFVLYVSVGLWYTTRLRVSGDEPHYLLMAQSLWREGDLDLRDNYAREDWREYTPGPIAPHYGAARADGRPFPAHSPGLPLLLAPFYARGGRIATVVVLAAIAAGVAALTRVLALRAGGTPGAAWFAWLAALGPPLFFYAFHVYTEAASALALFGGLVLMGTGGWAAAVAAGLAVGLLPWLHVKMIAAAGASGVVALARLRGRALFAFAVASVVMAAAYLAYLHHVFGRPTPLAIYHGAPAQMSGSAWSALAGLLLDRSFGLLWHAPVFLLSLAGLVPLTRRWRKTWPLMLAALTVIGPVLPWRMWWGGQSPPARFLVPLVPVLAVAAALRVAESPRGLARWRWPLAAIGMALALFAAARPGELLLLNRGDRPTRLWAALSGHGSIERYLPSIVNEGTGEWRVAAVWLVLLSGLVALDRLALRRDGVDRAFRSAGLPLAVLLAGSIVVDRFIRPPEKGRPYAASVVADGTSPRHQEAATPAARIPSTTSSR